MGEKGRRVKKWEVKEDWAGSEKIGGRKWEGLGK